MSFLDQLPFIGPTLSVIIPFLIVLGIVIFVHEYGHYIAARWSGVHSEAFSIGFGPELYGWDDSRGTRWKLSLIPLGGYVRFRGGDQDLSDEPVEYPDDGLLAFPDAPLIRRAFVVFAGPLANFLLTIALVAGIAMTSGVATDAPRFGAIAPGTDAAAAGFQDGDELLSIDGAPTNSYRDFIGAIVDTPGERHDVIVDRGGQEVALEYTYAPDIKVAVVAQNSAADDAGVKEGDIITAVDGKPLPRFEDLREITGASGGRPLNMTLMRDGQTIDVTINPRFQEVRQPDGTIEERWLLGITYNPQIGFQPSTEPLGPVSAVAQGVEHTGAIIGGTMFFIYELFAGRGDTGDLGGPIRIAEFSGEAAKAGIASLVMLIASLSTSIGLINLFPIPVLDGGHLLFYAIEAIRGKPLNQRSQEIALTIGLMMIVALMVFAVSNDLGRYF